MIESNDYGPMVTLDSIELSFLRSNVAPNQVEIPYLERQGFILQQTLDKEECLRLIDYFEKLGFQELNTLAEATRDIRDCQRVLIKSPELADALWDRARVFFTEMNIEGDPLDIHVFGPASLLKGRWKPVGLNPLFRLCKYKPGGHFAPHFDGFYQEDGDNRSFQTFMVYLNDGFEGGATNFLREGQPLMRGEDGKFCSDESFVEYRLRPETGAAIVFNHHRLHEGETLRSGVKYILRTDVMYERCESTLTDDQRIAMKCLHDAEQFESEGRYDEAVAMYKKAFKLCPELES